MFATRIVALAPKFETQVAEEAHYSIGTCFNEEESGIREVFDGLGVVDDVAPLSFCWEGRHSVFVLDVFHMSRG
jgi:hypothetical protein